MLRDAENEVRFLLRTAVISDDHIQILVEIEFEECVTHEILHADSKNGTGIFMELEKRRCIDP